MLSGELDFSNVEAVYQKSLAQWKNSSDICIDFSKLKSANSAGLALMVEWLKLANQQNKTIQFKTVSQDLLAIAKVAGMDKLFNIV